MQETILFGQSYVLATGKVAKHGAFGCLTGGKATPGETATNLICVGQFDLSEYGGADVTGDGTRTVRIKFPLPGETYQANIKSGDTIIVGALVYLSGPEEVTTTATGGSAAGRAVAIKGNKVLVSVTGF